MLANQLTRRAERPVAFESCERVDEAIWSAYQRHDKRAVMKALSRRYLWLAVQQARRRNPSCG